MKLASIIAVAFFSFFNTASAAGLERSNVLASAGFAVPEMEIPSPKVPYAVKIGTVKGGMNNSPVEITIDKTAWTIKGGMNHSPVDIKIDHAVGTITGGANLSPVDLKFAWSPEGTTVRGGANSSPVDYTVNWKNGGLEGYSNHSPLKLAFDMREGAADAALVRVTGYAAHAPVDLMYNKATGRLSGAMGHSPVDVNLVNCDLYDFLNYFFLFLK
jgi:hypothetical protein